MRLRGRISVFGEAFGSLLECATFSVPTRQELCSDNDALAWDGLNRYDPQLDGVGRQLADLGLVQRPLRTIAGDLPIQFGLASSTVLGFLHLGDLNSEEAFRAIAASDGQANGFVPSGADHAAVSAQEPGVFGLGTWTPCEYQLPGGSHLLLPDPEGHTSKLAAALAMRGRSDTLSPLIRRLAGNLLAGDPLDEDAMHEYCRILLALGVYSRKQQQVIADLLGRGIIAKGVGAMCDRAILVMAPESIWRGDPPMSLVPQ